MGGESSSSTAASGNVANFVLPPMGSETELVKIAGAQLCLIDGEESVLMQCGDFSLRLLKQAHSPLAAVVAAVGEVQWPVGKDAPVLKVWNRRYTFALPGLVYGILFPNDTPEHVIEQLEGVMDRFCTFEVHQEMVAKFAEQLTPPFIGGGSRGVAEYWTAVAPDVETLSSRIARQICSTSSIVADSIVMGGQWASLGIQQGGSFVRSQVGAGASTAATAEGGGPPEAMMSPRILKRMQQARRMSAVAKMMSRTLLKGAISATGHVAGSLGLDVNATTTISSSSTPESGGANEVAVASVDAFAKVVEAVETAGKSVYGVTSVVGTDLVQQKFGLDAGKVVQDSLGAVGNVINTAWTLNKMGLKMLLQVAAASTALSSRTSTGRRTSQSSYTTTSSRSEEQQPASPASTMSPLFHQITLSPPKQQQQQPGEQETPLALNLLLSDNTSSLQRPPPMRTQTFFGPSNRQTATLSSSFTPRGNYTSSSLPPGTHLHSPFQQYSRSQAPSSPSPFNFPFGTDQPKTP
ncbi:hypothetical protein CY35_01G046900 [Sphagnum magellanicum]|jgi:spartin|nr:hypothetical protein CY35_01G046900 [Sphagnum magellanicum]KAH9574249.1 hypothetical protein CY35_01G046900 [Sphagnum magellanicum]